MKKIQYILILLVCVISYQSVAQQDPHFLQYTDNNMYYNPAFAGSREMLNFTAVHREQWAGLDGRPRTTAFSIHSPLKYESVGVGLTAVNDMIGPIRQTIIAGDVSYTLKFQNKTKLSFGLKAAVNLLGFDRDKLYNSGNPVSALQQMDSKVNPNFGFGILYHGPKFFVGVSTPKILQNSYDGTKINKEQRHYFTTLGLVVDLDKDWKFRPTALLKITEGAPFSLDISASVIYKRVFWIGAMYRIDAAVGAFAQFRLFENFKLGLASEFGTQQLRKYNNGTFEVLMSYELKVFRRVNPNPRFF